MNTKLYDIAKEFLYEESINAIAGNYKRLEELELAIDWALARSPKSFYNIRENYYLWRSADIGNEFPKLIILYKFDEELEKVTLLNVAELDKVKDLTLIYS